MNSAAPILSFDNLIEILPATNVTDQKKIQFAKEVVYFAFSNPNNNSATNLADYIGKRFSENFNQKWNCAVWEWNKGGISFYMTSRIDIKYNNHKIIIWISS